jgi:hypothetical protein
MKVDCESTILGFIPTRYGSRGAINHCCCDYPEITSTVDARRIWDRNRDRFRDDWSKEFGDWPSDGKFAWPGHHILDLKHKGPPIAKWNVLPVPKDRHEVLNTEYPKCYEGNAPWNVPGPSHPYGE